MKKLTIEKAYRRYPDMIKGQVWTGSAARYWFRCLTGSGQPDYKQIYANHREGSRCPLCGKERNGLLPGVRKT
jgi:hypothetical protein